MVSDGENECSARVSTWAIEREDLALDGETLAGRMRGPCVYQHSIAGFAVSPYRGDVVLKKVFGKVRIGLIGGRIGGPNFYPRRLANTFDRRALESATVNGATGRSRETIQDLSSPPR